MEEERGREREREKGREAGGGDGEGVNGNEVISIYLIYHLASKTQT